MAFTGFWVASSENGFRRWAECTDSYLAYVQVSSGHFHSVESVCNDSVCGQWRPGSDCADAQADLGLSCPHMPENTFSYGEAHLFVHDRKWTLDCLPNLCLFWLVVMAAVDFAKKISLIVLAVWATQVGWIASAYNFFFFFFFLAAEPNLLGVVATEKF